MGRFQGPYAAEEILAERGWVRALSRRLARDCHQADDLEQETFLAAFRSGPGERGSLRGWLGTVLRNTARKSARTEARRDAREQRAGRRADPDDPARMLERAEMHGRVVQAVLALPEPYRATILRRYLEEQSPREVARAMDVPLETVRTRQRRALARLREVLAADHPDGRAGLRGSLLLVAAGRPFVAWTGGAGALLAWGGALVSTKVQLAVVVLLVAIGGTVAWRWQRNPEPVPEGEVARHAGEPVLLRGRADEMPDDGEVIVGLPPGTIQGVVVDEAEHPLPGCTVLLFRSTGSKLFARSAKGSLPEPSPRRPIDRTRTDGEGRYVFLALPSAHTYGVRAVPEAPGYASITWFRLDPTEVREARLRVRVGTALEVRLVDAEGRPLVGWTAVYADGWGSDWLRTSGTGRAHFPAVPPVSRRVTGLVPGRAKRTLVAPPEAATVVVTLGRPDGARLEGLVRDAGGTPVSGAEVLVTLNQEGGASYRAVTRTGADGRYVLSQLVRASRFFLNVEKRGFATYALHLGPAVRAGALLREDVTLHPTGSLRGRVLDVEGQPIAHARVGVAHEPMQGWQLFGALSDEEGRYVVEGVPPGDGRLLVAAEGYTLPGLSEESGGRRAPWELGLPIAMPAGAALERDLVLERGVALRGHVVDEAGAGVPWARVEAASGPDARHAAFRTVGRVHTYADEAGAFSFSGLAPRPDWKLVAGAGDLRTPRPVELVIAPGDADLEVELRVVTMRTIRGRVLDAAGDPLERAVVLMDAAPRDGGRRARSDAEGRFAFEAVSPGVHEVFLADLHAIYPIGNRHRVEVGGGSGTREVVLQAPASYVLEGMLVHPDGTPWANGEVSLSSADTLGYVPYTVRSEEDGSFCLVGLPGGPFEVEMRAWPLGQRITHEGRPVRIVGHEFHDVVGRVLGPSGEPVASGRVRFHLLAQATGSHHDFRFQAGRFEVSLPVRRAGISVGEPQDGAGLPLNAAPFYRADVALDGPLTLHLLPGRRIEGRVSYGEDRPLAGVEVRVLFHDTADSSRRERSGPRATTDEEGHYTLVGLHDGFVALDVAPPPGFTKPVNVYAEAGTERVDITLARGRHLAGRVVDEDGNPLHGVAVGANSRRAGRYPPEHEVRTAKDGTFRLDAVPDEEGLEVMARVPEEDAERLPFLTALFRDVAPDSEGLVLRMERGVFLAGLVSTPGGQPARSVLVVAHAGAAGRIAADGGGRALVGEGGTFRIGPLRSGSYVLVADPSRGPFAASEPVEVAAPATDIHLVLAPGAVVEGRCLGDGVAGAVVSWFMPQDDGTLETRSSWVKPSGSFRVHAVTKDQGMLYVRMEEDDRSALIEDVAPEDGPFEVTLTAAKPIEGHVYVKAGRRRHGRGVWAKRGGVIWAATQTDAEGAFALRGLPPGRYEVACGLPGVPPVRKAQPGDKDLVLRE